LDRIREKYQTEGNKRIRTRLSANEEKIYHRSATLLYRRSTRETTKITEVGIRLHTLPKVSIVGNSDKGLENASLGGLVLKDRNKEDKNQDERDETNVAESIPAA
jgi:hypothetical protein